MERWPAAIDPKKVDCPFIAEHVCREVQPIRSHSVVEVNATTAKVERQSLSSVDVMPNELDGAARHRPVVRLAERRKQGCPRLDLAVFSPVHLELLAIRSDVIIALPHPPRLVETDDRAIYPRQVMVLPARAVS